MHHLRTTSVAPERSSNGMRTLRPDNEMKHNTHAHILFPGIEDQPVHSLDKLYQLSVQLVLQTIIFSLPTYRLIQLHLGYGSRMYVTTLATLVYYQKYSCLLHTSTQNNEFIGQELLFMNIESQSKPSLVPQIYNFCFRTVYFIISRIQYTWRRFS